MKIPSAKGNPAMLEEIQKTFSAIPGIEQVVINPETGSVVLRYDADRHDDFHAGFTHRFNEHHAGHAAAHHRPPTNEIDALANKIEQEAEFLAEHSDAARAVVDFCRHCDREIKMATGNVMDLKMVLCVGLVGFMIFEVGAAAATPVWVTLTLFGLNHFIEMQSELAESARGRGRPGLIDELRAPRWMSRSSTTWPGLGRWAGCGAVSATTLSSPCFQAAPDQAGSSFVFHTACASLVVEFDRAHEPALQGILDRLRAVPARELAALIAGAKLAAAAMPAAPRPVPSPKPAARPTKDDVPGLFSSRSPLGLPTLSLAMAFSANPFVVAVNMPLMLWNAIPIARRAAGVEQ